MKLVNFMKKTSNDMVPEVIQVPYCAKVALGREKGLKPNFVELNFFFLCTIPLNMEGKFYWIDLPGFPRLITPQTLSRHQRVGRSCSGSHTALRQAAQPAEKSSRALQQQQQHSSTPALAEHSRHSPLLTWDQILSLAHV